MGNLIQDARYGFRMLASKPGLPALAVLTLALGIAANSTIFSWINSTLLNPIPGVAQTSDLVAVVRGESWAKRQRPASPPFSYLDYRDLRETTRSFSGLLAYHHEYASLTGAGKPERIYAVLTSANYFDVLGVRPILGRGFVPEEERPVEGSAAVAVISYDLWQSHFGGDRSIIDRKIQINRYPYTIIGVAPPGFQGCMTGLRGDVWIPLVMARLVWGFGGTLDDRGDFWLNVLGSLRPGIDSRQAEGELNLLMQRIAEHFPDQHQGPNQIFLDPLWRFGANVYLYTTLPMLLGLASMLLLLACANVANLLLVRSVTRRREIAIRLSMGASRWRLVRQLMVESLLLGLGGGVLAVVITTWSAGTFAAFVPSTTLPLTLNGHTDHTVVLVTLAIAIVTAVVFGVLPALRSSNVAPVTVLKEEAGSVSGGLHKSRLASALVVAQIAASVLLLVCAGLFTRSLESAQRSDPGFDPDHVLLESFELRPSGYSRVQGIEFDRQLLAKIEALPGVESVTLADFSPLSFTIRSDTVQPRGLRAPPSRIDGSRFRPGVPELLSDPADSADCRA